MRSPSPLLLLFLVSNLSLTKGHTRDIEKDYIVDGQIVSSKFTYVPLGFDISFPCEAISAVERTLGPQTVYWRRHTKNTNNTEILEASVDGVNERAFVTTKSSDMYMMGVQRAHNGTVFECVVTQRKAHPWKSGRWQSSSITRDPRFAEVKFISRHTLVIQDCGSDDKTTHKNELNPCLYGACKIRPNLTNKRTRSYVTYERLECICVEQYTGEYCQKKSKDADVREILFYMPVIAHPIAFVLFLIYMFCFKKRKFRKTAISALLVDKKKATDIQTLFPASFVEKTARDGRSSSLPATPAKPRTQETQKTTASIDSPQPSVNTPLLKGKATGNQ